MLGAFPRDDAGVRGVLRVVVGVAGSRRAEAEPDPLGVEGTDDAPDTSVLGGGRKREGNGRDMVCEAKWSSFESYRCKCGETPLHTYSTGLSLLVVHEVYQIISKIQKQDTSINKTTGILLYQLCTPVQHLLCR